MIFTATSGYSLLKHHGVASSLRLISRGYLRMTFAIVEMRTTQRLQTLQLENLIQEENGAFARSWISSVRRIRPIVLGNIRKDAEDLLEYTRPEERSFLESVKKNIEETQDLYARAEKYYEILFGLLEEGISPEAEEVLNLLVNEEEKIESRLRRLQSISIQRIHTVTARSEQAETRTLWMLSALILLAVSISLLATYLIHKLLVPLGELGKGVEVIGRGNLDWRVKVKRADEIGRLGDQINAMAAALQERDRRLRLTERLAAIGKMAAHVAHEVKNPLSSIGLNTEVVIEESQGIQPEEKKTEILQLAKSISTEVDRLTKLINRYLELGRPPKPRKAETDLRNVVLEVNEFMSPEFSENGVEMALVLPDEAVVANVDRDQIKQVIMNLVKNSMDAMEEGRERKIGMELSRSDGKARIIVSDTGRGMDEEENEKIFEPFFSSKKGGSGLGLPITRQIVLDHRGNIECTSEKGKGTRFEVTLPLK